MKCRDATAKIDLGQISNDLRGRLQFRAHLVFCTACRRYLGYSHALRRAARKLLQLSDQDSRQIESLNQKLLERLVKPRVSDSD